MQRTCMSLCSVWDCRSTCIPIRIPVVWWAIGYSTVDVRTYVLYVVYSYDSTAHVGVLCVVYSNYSILLYMSVYCVCGVFK